ncbi:hypothetical protein CMQ_5383 [Grosmannia clavigera kw1407]|uniref:Uncharacterized protein n=1 Tax=Grosmannia clavigera (strain kw1407 / UAMH 11150) TaxID=655863 RepID=F0XBF7_GROCL|nr:uncharacterized protein CMQ_5383 [Grosmannia clavigera kw1407]EFX05121.1 hypothetical protein CMQ_5383 [Grosmannia clavigera kw1407]
MPEPGLYTLRIIAYDSRVQIDTYPLAPARMLGIECPLLNAKRKLDDVLAPKTLPTGFLQQLGHKPFAAFAPISTISARIQNSSNHTYDDHENAIARQERSYSLTSAFLYNVISGEAEAGNVSPPARCRWRAAVARRQDFDGSVFEYTEWAMRFLSNLFSYEAPVQIEFDDVLSNKTA